MHDGSALSGSAHAIEMIADLELASRGGMTKGAGEDTSALLAIQAIAS